MDELKNGKKEGERSQPEKGRTQKRTQNRMTGGVEGRKEKNRKDKKD